MSSSSPHNVVQLNQAHCQLLAEQLNALEARVREMETTLVNQASRLHDALTEKLDNLFSEDSLIEFESFSEDEGVIRISETDGKRVVSGNSQEVLDSLSATREQLRLLNQTIANLQLPG